MSHELSYLFFNIFFVNNNFYIYPHTILFEFENEFIELMYLIINLEHLFTIMPENITT